MATHSSVLAWRIPGMGEPGGLSFMGSHRVRQDWSYLAAAAALILNCICEMWVVILNKMLPLLKQVRSNLLVQFSSVAHSCPTLHDHMNHSTARPPCPSPTTGVHSDSRPSSQWCHPAISYFVVPFSCPQSLSASESFPMSQLFAWGGQSTGVSALASFLPKKSQGWSPSEWTGWISPQSKGLSRVFSNTTVQKHQFFGAQSSSQSNSHIHTWPWEKP